jgi:hypothetical protein
MFGRSRFLLPLCRRRSIKKMATMRIMRRAPKPPKAMPMMLPCVRRLGILRDGDEDNADVALDTG